MLDFFANTIFVKWTLLYQVSSSKVTEVQHPLWYICPNYQIQSPLQISLDRFVKLKSHEWKMTCILTSWAGNSSNHMSGA